MPEEEMEDLDDEMVREEMGDIDDDDLEEGNAWDDF